MRQDFKPHEYQRRAIRYVEDTPYCALFLDMGLGKSVITLTAIRRLIDAAEVERVLVVAPLRVAQSTWAQEMAKWRHLAGLRVSVVVGTARQRERAAESAADVYVTSRDNFVWLCGYYSGRLPYDMCVIDELTSFKNARSVRFKAFRKVRGCFGRIVGLTGTPAPNTLVDLWAQMYCIDGGAALGKSLTRYREQYFDIFKVGYIPIKVTPKAGAAEAIRTAIAPEVLTMSAADYLTLPEMVEHDVEVALDDKTAKAYRAFERDRVAETMAGEVTAASAAVLMGKLGQYAAGAIYTDDGGVQPLHTAKVEALTEIVEAAQSPVLVFYRYRFEAEAIEARFKVLGFRVRRCDGDADVVAWNAGEVDVMLAHPASVSYGLNMQSGGHYIVWTSPGWDLEQYLQANARLHRQGQRQSVHVYRLVATGTVDERAVSALARKDGSQRAMLEALKKMSSGDVGN